MIFVGILNISHLNNIKKGGSRAGESSPTADDATVSAPIQRSRASLFVFLRSTILSRRNLRSVITGPASTPIALQQLNLELCRTASPPATAVFSMLIPVSEEKFLWVNTGRRTKSWTHATGPFTFSCTIATPSRDTVKMGCNSD